MKVHTDIDFNPRGLHANSGVAQWFDECLVAVVSPDTLRGKYGVVELPARSVEVYTQRIKFDTGHQAECWIERNYPSTVVLVHPQDITEEIERRKTFIAWQERIEQENALN